MNFLTSSITAILLLSTNCFSMPEHQKVELMESIQIEKELNAGKIELLLDLQRKLAKEKERIESNKSNTYWFASIATITLSYGIFRPAIGGDFTGPLVLANKVIASMIGGAAAVSAGYNAIRITFRVDKMEEISERLDKAKKDLQREQDQLSLYEQTLLGSELT